MSTVAKGYRVPRYRLALVKDGAASYARETVPSVNAAADVVTSMLASEPTECFVVLYLNNANRLIGSQLVTRGTIGQCAIGPLEIFRGAIVACASAIILAHNHPSGDPTPSADDIETTRKVREAGRILGIEVLDHIIATREGRWTSLADRGLMDGAV